MRPGSFIVVAAVVLVAGFAAADAIRGRVGREATAQGSSPVQTSPTRVRGPQPQPEAPSGWPRGALQGSLVFTDAHDCRIRVIGLAGGEERRLARFAGDCQLWAPPVGSHIAYGLGPTTADGFSPFKLADLDHPTRELGGYRALFGVVLWSPDGQRVAWCGRRRIGFDLEVGGPARRLPTCPVAYTPDDAVAYAIGNRLNDDRRGQILRVDGGITFAAFPDAKSIVVVVDGQRVEAYNGGVLSYALDLPARLQGRTPILSPNGCSAAFRPLEPPGQIDVVDLGCAPGRGPLTFFGNDAAWSPDGRWLAVAERETIAFHRIGGAQRTIRWPAAAAELAWRPR